MILLLLALLLGYVLYYWWRHRYSLILKGASIEAEKVSKQASELTLDDVIKHVYPFSLLDQNQRASLAQNVTKEACPDSVAFDKSGRVYEKAEDDLFYLTKEIVRDTVPEEQMKCLDERKVSAIERFARIVALESKLIKENHFVIVLSFEQSFELAQVVFVISGGVKIDGHYFGPDTVLGVKEAFLGHSTLMTATRRTQLLVTEKHIQGQLLRSGNLLDIVHPKASSRPSIVSIIPYAPQEKMPGRVQTFPAVRYFARQLADQMNSRLIDSAVVIEHFGIQVFGAVARLHIEDWLREFETVILLADPISTPWSTICKEEAEVRLVVALPEFDDASDCACQKGELVLLSETKTRLKEFVDSFDCVHHIKVPNIDHLLFGKRTALYEHNNASFSSSGIFLDLDRLVRRLKNETIGLVLGGGGARGLAHLGVLRAIQELGIKVDFIGGTSIGSLVGSLYAQHEAHYVPVLAKMRRFAREWRTRLTAVLDLTYPYTGLLTGHSMNRSLWKILGEMRLEDLPIPFFCTTTDLGKLEQRLHRSGVAWPIIRASMSLAGYFPPMSTRDGALLLDGGYTDTLPIEKMQKLYSPKLIIAVDVARQIELHGFYCGETVSGTRSLLVRLYNIVARCFGGKTFELPPSMQDIQTRLLFAGDRKHRYKDEPGVLILRPPVADIGTLEFGRFDEIYQRGYTYAKSALSNL